jgi:putative transposase
MICLVAILDWYSRKVLAWRLSNTLETTFCLECLDEALAHRQSMIFNTDQGAQFTSLTFTGRLAQAGSGSVWMVGDGRMTISLSNDSGDPLNMRRCIF